MSEKLIEIVNSIHLCEQDSKAKRIIPIARVHCVVNGNYDTFWFTNEAISPRVLGNLRSYGHFVPKNSSIAVKIQRNEVGSIIEYEGINQIKKRISYVLKIENRSDFQNQTIIKDGDTQKYQYRNINEFLETLINNQEEINEIEEKIEILKKEYDQSTSHQKRKISLSINKLLEQYRILTDQQEDLKNITIYIRKQGEMRYSLIVDTIQTRIKTQNLFDGKTIIINGGPGTGKSTTMIHRLAYLTDLYAIEEDKTIGNYKLNDYQRKQLIESIKSNRDWMFFSPSPLLRDYLADAMMKEGLKNTFSKVWNWRDYCKHILQNNYNLLESENNKAPFCDSKFKDTLFYQGYNIIQEFSNFYVKQLQEIKYKLPKLDGSKVVYSWTSIALNIMNRFEGTDNFDIPQFIRLFNSLESIYANDCKELLNKNKIFIKELADYLFELLDDHTDVKNDIIDILSLEELLNDNDEDSIEDTGVLFDAPSQISDTKFNEQILRDELQKWIKVYSQFKNNKIQIKNEKYRIITEILAPIVGSDLDEDFYKISELIIFEQYAQYTRGLIPIMVNTIPSRYKKFRKHLIKNKYEGCNLPLLRDILHRKQGKELHHQELSLLLGFINNTVKRIKSLTNQKFNNTYMNAYEDVSRPIIGIDEATDFSTCDIYAIHSLLSLQGSSLTLCGDLMQRLTNYGIQSWNELDDIIEDKVVVEMKTSYRQSSKLLDVAKSIYVDTLRKEPSYKSFMKSQRVPEPLIYIDEDEFSKIKWISKRISEVFRAYGDQLPSIAIFVNEKGYIPKFSRLLQETEFFNDNSIKVYDGFNDKKNIKDTHINIYPIDVVKGMEFDVVFFHNLDNSSYDNFELKRYIYVGVSRAAFFLGITMSKDIKEISKYFVKDKDWFKI